MNFPCRPVFLATLFCPSFAREFIYSLFPFLFILRNYVALLFSLLIEATPLTKKNKTRTQLNLISTFAIFKDCIEPILSHYFQTSSSFCTALLATFIHATLAPTIRLNCVPTSLPSTEISPSGLNISFPYSEDVILTVCHCDIYLDVLKYCFFQSHVPNKYLIFSSS